MTTYQLIFLAAMESRIKDALDKPNFPLCDLAKGFVERAYDIGCIDALERVGNLGRIDFAYRDAMRDKAAERTHAKAARLNMWTQIDKPNGGYSHGR